VAIAIPAVLFYTGREPENAVISVPCGGRQKDAREFRMCRDKFMLGNVKCGILTVNGSRDWSESCGIGG
jgi:hypothetical protein